MGTFGSADASPSIDKEFARQYTALIDTALQWLYQWAYEQAAQEVALIPQETLAILATGGYGRADLAPCSDIDLTFVPLHENEPFTERLVKHLFQALMNGLHTQARLKVGYAYRLMDDCPTLDAKTRTGLIDMRLVAGSRAVAERFEMRFWQTLDPTGFMLERYQEYRARWAKQGEGILRIEPNLKEGRGGLRDRHTLNWLSQVRYGIPAHAVLPTLIAEGILSQTEADALNEATQTLSRVRAWLHALTGEARDRLTLTRQAEIAERLGIEQSAFTRWVMDALSTHARIAQRAIERLIRSKLILGLGLDSVNLQIEPAPTLERESPEWCLWVFRLAQKYRLALSPQIEARIEATIATISRPPEPREAGHALKEILSQPGEVYRVLEPMARLGVLSWAIPAFGAVIHLPAGDPTHEFTVGEHTLQAIRILDSFVQSTSDPPALTTMLLSQLPRPELLYMALLLHDVGKQDGSRPHAEVGAEIARETAYQLGWDEYADDLAFLVRHHLLMAQTARQRDLHLPETIREFVRTVEDPERLQMLYLLTCADTQAVGERIWTPAQAAFLQELYRRAMRAMEEGEPVSAPNLGALRKRLMRELSRHPLPHELIEQHIQQMPSAYLLNTPAEQMMLHIHYIQRVREGKGPVIEFHQAPESPYTELTICTFDDPQPGLLSKIAGVLYALDAEVSAARVLTREDEPRVALDTLWITMRHRPLSPNQCTVLEKALRRVLTGEQSVSELLREHQKDPDSPLTLRQLQIHDDASESYTVVDMQTAPDAGALYRAAYRLSRLGWNIHSARLGQWAGRTLLSFYCTDTQGNKIPPEQYALLQTL
ncbi:Bifunctional uridylyltransferase/uridylyl-removing enzyme [bacterium HR15]|nr:Bifunctional uridylyltransferase/uridylyl-removing enzyme [bacterium HR15]